jgi:hypothetical protein
MASRWWPPALRFAPYDQTVDQPNVVVDGSANESTVLTLSHWPHAPCPADLVRDLSAGSAMAYLDHAALHGPAELVTNNHFDQDGLVSAFALCDPEAASERAAMVSDVASAGDFAVCESRDAARVSMAISAYADAERSPLGEAARGDYATVCGQLYLELLPRIAEWMDRPAQTRDLWADEDAQLAADLALFRSGAVSIDEVPDLDLSVVTLSPSTRSSGGHRFGAMWSDRIHPIPLHGAVDGFTVLVRQGGWCELRYRYESWVQYVTRRPRPRVDLSPLADELTSLEPGDRRWTFDGVSALTPALHLDDHGDSDLDPDDVRARIEHALRTTVPAWNPYDRPGVEA